MTGILIGLIVVGTITGFITGVLVYRNNLRKAQEKEMILREKLAAIQGDLKSKIGQAKEVGRKLEDTIR